MERAMLLARVGTPEEVTEARRRKTNRLVTKIIIFSILFLYAFFLMSPFYVIFTTSITSIQEILGSMRFVWFPESPTFQAYADIFHDPISEITGMPIMLIGFLNTLWMTLLPLIVSLFISGLAAFAYAKLKFKGKEALFMFELVTMMIPGATLTIPTFIFYDNLHWTNTVLPMIIPGMFGGATTIFFLRSYMMSIPTETVEAAKIDGLGPLGTYIRIMLPQTYPAFVAQFIFGFVGGYNSYMGPLLYLQYDEKRYTLQLALSEITKMFPDANQHCAGAILALIPLIIVFLIFQKLFIEGISIGGGKE